MTSFDDLQRWAAGIVVADLDSVRRQITEYGSIDLEIMGMGLLEASSFPTEQHDVKRGMEMALVFYLQGKIARCISALSAGQMPSDDTYRDLRVYSLMLGHVRELGHWKIEGAQDGDRRRLFTVSEGSETGGDKDDEVGRDRQSGSTPTERRR